MDKNNLRYKFLESSKGADYSQEVTLELYNDSRFKLENNSFGFFGTAHSYYTGSYRFENFNLTLMLEQAHNYRYTAVDNEPSVHISDHKEIIETTLSPNDTITFIFPVSDGEWEITMKKVNY